MDPTTAASSGSPAGYIVQRKAMDLQKAMSSQLVEAAAQTANRSRDIAQISSEAQRRFQAEQR